MHFFFSILTGRRTLLAGAEYLKTTFVLPLRSDHDVVSQKNKSILIADTSESVGGRVGAAPKTKPK